MLGFRSFVCSKLNLRLYCSIFFKDGSCNGLQHYAALGRDKVMEYSAFGRLLWKSDYVIWKYGF